MARAYVSKVEGAYRIGSTRVSLDSLVHSYREGVSLEGMVDSYPDLSLEEVHGALAYYLKNQKIIDAYLRQTQRESERHHRRSRTANADLIAKLERGRIANQIPG